MHENSQHEHGSIPRHEKEEARLLEQLHEIRELLPQGSDEARTQLDEKLDAFLREFGDRGLHLYQALARNHYEQQALEHWKEATFPAIFRRRDAA